MIAPRILHWGQDLMMPFYVWKSSELWPPSLANLFDLAWLADCQGRPSEHSSPRLGLAQSANVRTHTESEDCLHPGNAHRLTPRFMIGPDRAVDVLGFCHCSSSVLARQLHQCHGFVQAELQRLRQQAAQQEAARQAQARAAAVQAAAVAPQASTTPDQLLRTLKISWDPQVWCSAEDRFSQQGT